MRAVAAVPAVALLAGTAAGLVAPDIPSLIEHAVLLGSSALAVWAWRVSRPRVLLASVAAAFLAGGALLAADAWQRAWRPTLRVVFEELARVQRAEAAIEGRRLPVADEAFTTLTGVLRADAAPSATGVSLSVDVDGIDLRAPGPLSRASKGPSDREPVRREVFGGILVTVVGTLAADRIEEWRAGRRVRMPVQLRRTARYLDPGLPDLERGLAVRGTTLVGTVKSGALVDVLGRGSWWNECVADVRSFARGAVAAAVGRWSAESAAIVAAIVIGDRAGLDPDVQRRLQEAGTYHVIAISGGNIAILAGLMLGVFRFAGLLGRGAMLSAIAALIAYAELVGGGASVDRATLMAVVYFGGRALDQRSPPLNTLAVVVALIVSSEPLSVADPAFVLTFGATLAILVALPFVHDRRVPRLIGPVVAMFVASLAVEMVLFPVSGLVFSRVTVAGLALNFLAIPLMGVAQVAGMLVVPFALVSTRAAEMLGFIAHVGAAGLVWSAGLLRYAPLLSYRVAPPAWWAVVVYYLALGTSWTLWRRRARKVGSAETASARAMRRGAAVAAFVTAVWMLAEPWAFVARRGDGRLHVTFVDVGQGDSAFVKFPHGSTLLVDAGGLSTSSRFDVGDRVVAPVLRDQGVRRLDYVALTHGDPDHIGGAPSILREFRPREVWEGIPVPRFEPLTALQLQAQPLGARWASVYAGDRMSVDDVEITLRHPTQADWERQRVRNDDSIVLELRWRDVSIVLTGDIGKATERALAATIPPARVRVLKVPHHGSRTSSTPEFLRALHPQVAVVSVGRSNHFGHPAPDVLQRYRDVGAEVFRTDQDGAVVVDTDGTSIDVHAFSGRTFSLDEMQPRRREGTKDPRAQSALPTTR